MNKIINETGRTCNKCSTFKPWSDYSPLRHGANKHMPHCKKCRRKHERLKRAAGHASIEDIMNHFDYDPNTGKIYKPSGGKPKEAGCLQPNGYVRIRFKGKYYFAQRIAWLLQTGEWPELDVDHINRNRADNRWNNLRELTRSDNCMNSEYKAGRSPHLPRGVRCEQKVKGPKWIVTYRRKYIGTFDSLFEAAAQRRRLE